MELVGRHLEELIGDQSVVGRGYLLEPVNENEEGAEGVTDG